MTIFILFCSFVGFLVGAIAHEKDLARNFNKTGDAKAWFFEIKRDAK